MKVFLQEEGSDLIDEVLAADDRAATTRLTLVECQAAFARTAREKRLTRAELTIVQREFESRWDDLVVVELDAGVTKHAGRLVHDHALRASDAVHLASAVSLAAGAPEEMSFACWDARLWQAAKATGFRMTPPSFGQ